MNTFKVFFGALLALFAVGAYADTVPTDGHFVNFETPHVSPIAMSPNGLTLAACNTPDGRVEIFDLTSGTPEYVTSIPVGLDPVSARFRTNTELWVVNHVSDSVSVVNMISKSVTGTVRTLDEPTDVVFAGNPQKVFVSCSQVNKVQVFNPQTLGAPLQTITIAGEEPRALAVSADGTKVYCAVFESGNRTTLLGGGSDSGDVISFPPNVVNGATTPHGGVNPPFNGTGVFIPAKTNSDPAPPVGLIVKQQQNGKWLDDTNADWTSWISGPNAAQSGRHQFWQLLDHDLVVIDANAFTVSYLDHLMNICMAMAVNPVTGEVNVVGTDAKNEIRFEPQVKGIFTRVMLAKSNAAVNAVSLLKDLNIGHLNYTARTLPQSERDKSIGDPRGMVWNSAGSIAYITGMGSNNVIVVNASGDRAGANSNIAVGEGPTGLVYDGARNQLYVLNKFASTISVVDLNTNTQSGQVPFYDPSPSAIKLGRKHVYDTHKNSGLGQIACASCHVDSRMDRLAWDLGDPSGTTVQVNDEELALNLNGNIPSPGLGNGFTNIHSMKGPMTTQTLQDIIGHEPLHWRGDRAGLEAFNGAFIGLQGDDTNLTINEMQEFEDFLHTIHFAPNPFRNLDNTLPVSLNLEGHFKPGDFGGPGEPLGTGNAVAGLNLYRTQLLDKGLLNCVSCHTLPSGDGTNMRWNPNPPPGHFDPIQPGPNGQRHLMMVAVDGSTQHMFKVPQMRNLYEKVGAEFTNGNNSLAGFGFAHDGSVDSIARFVSENAFNVTSNQQIADLVALLLCWSGSDFGVVNNGTNRLEPPGNVSQDVHAAVGRQVTIVSSGANLTELNNLIGIVNASPRIQMIAKGVVAGVMRGWLYVGSNNFQTDRAGVTQSLSQVVGGAGPGTEVTFTVVPIGEGTRTGVDRDLDGFFDNDEIGCGSNPADPNSFGDTAAPVITLNGGNVSLECGSAYVEQGATATDTCEGNLNAELEIDASAVNTSAPGVYTVTYNVSDSSNNAATEVTRQVTITDATIPVITLNGGDLTLDCTAIYFEPGVSANDTCQGDLSANIVIDASAVNTATPGVYTVTYNVSDASGNAATQVTRTVTIVDNGPPIITLIGGNMNIECGGTYVESGAIAADSCEGSISSNLVIDASAVNTTTPGTYNVTYNVSDASGNAALQATRQVTVADGAGPVITLNGGDVTIECGGTYTEQGATATDSCEGNLTANIVTDSSAVNTATPGVYNVTYNVSDSANNAATQVTRTVTVSDTVKPTITLTGGSVNIECGDAYVEQGATASDSCQGSLTANIVTDSSAVNTAIPGIYNVTYNVSDASNNAATQVSRQVTVADNTGPVITLTGGNVTVECAGSYSELGASANDVCDGDRSANIVIDSSAVNTNFPGVYAVIYDVSDSLGNPAIQVVRQVTVADNTDPVITLIGGAQSVACGGSYTESGATANDTCDGDLTANIVIDASEITSAITTESPGVYAVHYSVVDAAGNSVTVNRSVTLQPCPKGASCFPDGTCFEMTQSKCLAAGGTYQGDNTTCALTVCTQTTTPIIHSADQNTDHSVSLTELLRLIQLFNLGAYHCDAAGEDGFNPGIGDQNCTPHASDYSAQNWSIGLTELLRLIQIFNMGGYYSCPAGGTGDGFCPVQVN